MFPALLLLVGAAAAPPRLPLAFEANRGQADAEVKFVARGKGGVVLLTSREAVFRVDFARKAIRMRWLGANPDVRPEPLERLPGKVNYFLGKDPRKWRTNVPTYARVRYQGLYPGVDLTFYGTERQLEYDFELQPGADPGVIQVAFEGRGATRLEPEGGIRVEAGGGLLRHRRPVIYQVFDGQRRRLAGCFVKRGSNRFSFAVPEYDPARPLFIDPVISYATYLGGSGTDAAYSLAVDSSGCVYVVGTTTSLNFPADQGAPGPVFRGVGDAFVTKFNREGSAVLYSTYLGGRERDAAWAITLDPQGGALITGFTTSPDFPVKNAAQAAYGGGGTDAFVAKLSPAGDALVFSSYVGGAATSSALPRPSTRMATRT